MKKFLLMVFLFNYSSLLAEEVPAGYVAKWETIYLTESDYKDTENLNCESFAEILSKGKLEQPQISPLKIINATLDYFIKGYKNRERISFDTVVVWPNYEQSDWYVLMAKNKCFIRWIAIQPDNIQSIIDDGKHL
tara:strand:+ start:274 stop:678 length:405 start_codon:yes stop_codon:yes gene_type:complete